MGTETDRIGMDIGFDKGSNSPVLGKLTVGPFQSRGADIVRKPQL